MAIFVNNKPIMRKEEAFGYADHEQAKKACYAQLRPRTEAHSLRSAPAGLNGGAFSAPDASTKDGEGLLVIANDGDLAHRLTHPGTRVVKRYRVIFTATLIRTSRNCSMVSITKATFLRPKRLSLPRKWAKPQRRLNASHHGKEARSAPPVRSEPLLRQEARPRADQVSSSRTYHAPASKSLAKKTLSKSLVDTMSGRQRTAASESLSLTCH